MINEVYVVVFGLFAKWYLFWGFKNFPLEKQMAAAIPVALKANGHWSGLNLTWYGILIANAVVVSVLVFCILMGAIKNPPLFSFMVLLLLFLFALPAARIIARWIEKKSGTFTVGGAAFVGMLMTPPIIFLADLYLSGFRPSTVEFLPVLAALALSYCFGEGLGRLACISFGCCYGKPLAHMPELVQKLFANRNFVFLGKTKKIAYAHGWEGIQIFPVQALTAYINISAGVAGTILFVQGRFQWALVTGVATSFGWRVVSEFLRADYRGEGRLTAYQIMGTLSLLYGLSWACFFPQPMPVKAELMDGLAMLWRPEWILCLQGVWMGIFWYMGKSEVTGSELRFFVHSDQV